MYRAEIGLHTYCKYLKISELVKLSQTLRTGAVKHTIVQNGVLDYCKYQIFS